METVSSIQERHEKRNRKGRKNQRPLRSLSPNSKRDDQAILSLFHIGQWLQSNMNDAVLEETLLSMPFYQNRQKKEHYSGLSSDREDEIESAMSSSESASTYLPDLTALRDMKRTLHGGHEPELNIIDEERATPNQHNIAPPKKRIKHVGKPGDNAGLIIGGVNPLDVSDAPGVELLAPDEVDLCTTIRLMPMQYLHSRDVLMQNSRERGFYKKSAAQKMLRIDVNKTGKLYDFFQKRGWILSPPE